jgi:hypothetical protein
MENETTIAKKPETFKDIVEGFKITQVVAFESSVENPTSLKAHYDNICYLILPKAIKLATNEEELNEVFGLTRERHIELRNLIESKRSGFIKGPIKG